MAQPGPPAKASRLKIERFFFRLNRARQNGTNRSASTKERSAKPSRAGDQTWRPRGMVQRGFLLLPTKMICWMLVGGFGVLFVQSLPSSYTHLGWDTPSSKCGWVLTDTASCESNQTDGCKKPASMDILSGGFKHFLNIHPYLGKISILTHIFRRGCLDHQVVLGFSQQTNEYFGTCWSFLQPITWCH